MALRVIKMVDVTLDNLIPKAADGTLINTSTYASSFSMPFVFGCQTHETGLFIKQLEAGIMGMSADTATLPFQMYKNKMIDSNSFSLCFSRESQTDKENGVHAGLMTLGGVEPSLHWGPMVYARELNHGGWFGVKIMNIFLREGGDPLTPLSSNPQEKLDEPKIVHVQVSVSELNRRTIIVDSGTTITYLPRTVKNAFMSAFFDLTGLSFLETMNITFEEVMALPTIVFQLAAAPGQGEVLDPDEVPNLAGTSFDPQRPSDIIVAMPPYHYMAYNPTTKLYFSRIKFDGAVLGANFMQGHNIHFDSSRHRVGFAESSCDWGTVVGWNDDNSGKEDSIFCQESLWGACEAAVSVDFESCVQKMTYGTRGSNRTCSENRTVMTRPCSIGMCGQDHCRVPFKVHASIGIDGADAKVWSKSQEDQAVEILANLLEKEVRAGDIDILLSSDWKSDSEKGKIITVGMKLVFEISIHVKSKAEDSCENEVVLQGLAETVVWIRKRLNEPTFVQQFISNLASTLSDTIEINSTETLSRNSLQNVPVDGGISKLLEVLTLTNEGNSDPSTVFPQSSNVSKDMLILLAIVVVGYVSINQWQRLKETLRRNIRSIRGKLAKTKVPTSIDHSELDREGVQLREFNQSEKNNEVQFSPLHANDGESDDDDETTLNSFS
uniref:Peptidase A1 domain-containing protein n=1 Tax=Corethron hystrix TaxID=216773 RepID=A0A7S1C248_9STRA|mmetsp:Transcript_8260/g.17958  ORF Transcript_8260/g.17958 Transcript_8260/m.17958 type:complete len:665 (+) Transcript_8260:45-2039(+)